MFLRIAMGEQLFGGSKMAAGTPKMATGTPKMATGTPKMAAGTPKMAACSVFADGETSQNGEFWAHLERIK